MTIQNKIEICAVVVAAVFLIAGNIFWSIMFLGVAMISASVDGEDQR